MIIQLTLNTNDIPSSEEMEDCIMRLKKDAAIIGKYPGPKEGKPENFLKIAAFLEILNKRTAKYREEPKL